MIALSQFNIYHFLYSYTFYTAMGTFHQNLEIREKKYRLPFPSCFESCTFTQTVLSTLRPEQACLQREEVFGTAWRWKLFLSGSAGTGAPNLSALWPVHSAQDHAVFYMNTTAGYLFGLCADRAITKQVRLKPKQWLLGTLKSIYLIGFI